MLKKVNSAFNLGKVLKTNPDCTHLCFNTLNKEIIIIEIGKTGKIEKETTFKVEEEGTINDFICLKNNFLSVVTSKWVLATYKYDFSSGAKKVGSHTFEFNLRKKRAQ